jgi:hypothetical protein
MERRFGKKDRIPPVSDNRGAEVKKAKVYLSENSTYRVINGEINKLDKSNDGFEKQGITWQEGKQHIIRLDMRNDKNSVPCAGTELI